MTVSQFADWAAYYAEEPFGPEIESLRAAVIATTVANSMRSPKQAAFRVTDFQIGYKPPPLSQTAMDRLFAFFGD